MHICTYTGVKVLFGDDIYNLLFESPALPVQGQNIKQTNATIEIYIDPASLGMTNQLLDIVEAGELTENTYRLAAWWRFNPTTETCEKLGIRHTPLTSNTIQQQMLEQIANIAVNHSQVSLKVSCNSRWCYGTLMKLHQLTLDHPNIQLNSVTFYEDGAYDCVELSQAGLNWSYFAKVEHQMGEFFAGRNPEPPQDDLYTLYSWNEAFSGKVSYKVLREECYSIFTHKGFLARKLGDSLSKIDWNRFSDLSVQQQEAFLTALNFNKTQLQAIYDGSPGPNIVFTGTTTWSLNPLSYSAIAKQQSGMTDGIRDASSPYFLAKDADVFFKGHPSGGAINAKTLQKLGKKVTSMSPELSFEVLMMTGMMPDKVCGMAGSIYFSIPTQNIGFITFNSVGNQMTMADALADPLVKVMLKLKLITQKDIII